ncbi:MAG: hypothetical protein V3V14_05835 [Saprospiraceae bacterium]
MINDDIDYKSRLSRGVILGSIGHPVDGNYDPRLSATKLVEQWIEGDYVMIKREILPTPEGQLLLVLTQAGVEFGVSSRGAGTAKSL